MPPAPSPRKYKTFTGLLTERPRESAEAGTDADGALSFPLRRDAKTFRYVTC